MHFSSGCSPYPAPWRLLRGPPKALLQLLPPCYQPDPQLPSCRCAVGENTGRWGTSPKLGEGAASGQGQRGTQATGLTVPSLTWPWSAGPVSIPSDSAKDLFLLEGTECYLHPVCSRPGVWKLDTGPGGDRDIPESHSSLWKRLLETRINSVAAVCTDLWPLPDPKAHCPTRLQLPKCSSLCCFQDV